MKLILRQYLADLRERDELDAILPDLLSEIGFNVLSTPSRGTRQYGVDVAAVGFDEYDGNRRKLFLFTIKPGDLRRGDWDGSSLQAVRPSLNEILDSYIRNRIPDQYKNLDIVICLCLGGEIKENVQEQWIAFHEKHTTNKISFREWNGDKLAELLLSGVLKEELLETQMQTHFRKSIAMIDHPDVAYRFFCLLTQGLLKVSGNRWDGIKRLRQVYVCLWVLYVWAREAGNLEAPFRASEYAVLHIWNHCRSAQEAQGEMEDTHIIVLRQTIKLHLVIAEELIVKKLGPYAEKPYALSMAVKSQSPIDVNLTLFEQLGRLSLYGIWQHWRSQHCPLDEAEADVAGSCRRRDRALRMAIAMIHNNPTLKSPIRDDFAIEIALLMTLAQLCGVTNDLSVYLKVMVHRVMLSVERRSAYPIPKADYNDLAGHPASLSDEYFEEHTRGSVLYPLLIAWLDRLSLHCARNALVACIEKELSHTTQQVWVPNQNTEARFWIGGRDHGKAIVLPRFAEPPCYAELLHSIIADHDTINSLSTTKYESFLPIFLMACRHFRMPIPPHFWFLEVTS